MKNWNFYNTTENEAELSIHGEIAQKKHWFFEDNNTCVANDFCKELKKLNGKKLTIYINSPGGDVVAASQIYTALIDRKGKTIVKVDGMAASAASVIAMAGSEVWMAPTALMMIHNPWTFAVGDADEMRHEAEILDEVKESILNAYQAKCSKSREEISKLMDDETWMSSKKAIELGFADYEIPIKKNIEPAALNALFDGQKAVWASAYKVITEQAVEQQLPTEVTTNDSERLIADFEFIKTKHNLKGDSQ